MGPCSLIIDNVLTCRNLCQNTTNISVSGGHCGCCIDAQETRDSENWICSHWIKLSGQYLRGFTCSNPSEMLTRNLHCKKITQCACSIIICSLCCLARNLWNARKSHLALIKFKKPLWRPPRTALGSLQRSIYPLAGGKGTGCPFQELSPAIGPFQTSGFGPSGLACHSPRILKPHSK